MLLLELREEARIHKALADQLKLKEVAKIKPFGADAETSIVIVPEVKDGATTGITLLHVHLHDRLPASTARSVMQGYRGRFAALRDAVTETEPVFREDLLADQPVLDLLIEPIQPLADRWRT